MSLDLKKLSTETRNRETMNLDTMSALELVTAMNRQDHLVPEAVEKVLPQIAAAADRAAETLAAGGRIIYMGAGTSGRLGVLDAVECPPTFGVAPETVVGLIAGGDKAFVKAVEGAEDREDLGAEDLQRIHLNRNDFVVGIAASGRTPYVIGGLRYAGEVGCHTAAIACNQGSPVGQAAEIAIEVIPGPEVLTGSTRLKAGTCQKMILNMISTTAMVRTGKAYENLMVDVMQTNEKLRIRAKNMVMEATGVDGDTASAALTEAEGSAKVAITMLLADCSAQEAKLRLEKARGHVREAIQ